MSESKSIFQLVTLGASGFALISSIIALATPWYYASYDSGTYSVYTSYAWAGYTTDGKYTTYNGNYLYPSTIPTLAMLLAATGFVIATLVFTFFNVIKGKKDVATWVKIQRFAFLALLLNFTAVCYFGATWSDVASGGKCFANCSFSSSNGYYRNGPSAGFFFSIISMVCMLIVVSVSRFFRSQFSPSPAVAVYDFPVKIIAAFGLSLLAFIFAISSISTPWYTISYYDGSKRHLYWYFVTYGSASGVIDNTSLQTTMPTMFFMIVSTIGSGISIIFLLSYLFTSRVVFSLKAPVISTAVAIIASVIALIYYPASWNKFIGCDQSIDCKLTGSSGDTHWGVGAGYILNIILIVINAATAAICVLNSKNPPTVSTETPKSEVAPVQHFAAQPQPQFYAPQTGQPQPQYYAPQPGQPQPQYYAPQPGQPQQQYYAPPPQGAQPVQGYYAPQQQQYYAPPPQGVQPAPAPAPAPAEPAKKV